MAKEVVGCEFARRLVNDLAAMLQHHDTIGMRQRMVDVVQGEHEGLVATLEERQDIGALHAIQRRDRLIADEDRAAVVERAPPKRDAAGRLKALPPN